MTREEALKELAEWREQMENHGVPDYGKKLMALGVAIEALTQDCNQIATDLISRSGAIKEVSEWATDILHPKNLIKEDAIHILESLPSADAVQIPIKLEKRYPQSRDEDITDAFMRGYLAGRSSADRPTGEWVRKYDKHINCYWYECNQCGEDRPRNVFGNEWSSPYCPNCGAKMGG